MTAVTMLRYQSERSHKDSFKKNNNSSQRELGPPVLWLAGAMKGYVTEEGFTPLKRLINPRLRAVSCSLSHLSLKKCVRTLEQKGDFLTVR